MAAPSGWESLLASKKMLKFDGVNVLPGSRVGFKLKIKSLLPVLEIE